MGYLGFCRARVGDGLGGSCRRRERRGEDPGTVRQGMDGFDLAGFGREPQRLGRDLQELRGVAEVEPGLDPVVGGLEHRDAVVRPHRGDALAGPAIAVAGLEAVAVEDAGDQIVIGDQHQLAHGCDDVGRCAVALPAPALGQADLAVDAADPVDNENDLGAASSISATTSWIRVRTMRFFSRASVVGADQTVLQVRGQHAERGRIDGSRGRRRVMSGDLALDLRHLASALFQRASSSPATSRLAGSAASYWRKARSAA